MKVAILGKQNPMFFRERMKADLESAGLEADIIDMESRTFLDFASELADYDAIITCGEKIPTQSVKVLGKGRVKLVSRWGVGTDEIDKEEASRQGIAICNAAGSLSTAVAECALGMPPAPHRRSGTNLPRIIRFRITLVNCASSELMIAVTST